MRFGLIGDVHAEDQRLRVALEALGREQVDRVLCTGDVVDGLGDVNRSFELLAASGVFTVRGNHDRWIRDDSLRTLPNAHRMGELSAGSITMLEALPPSLRLESSIGTLLLCHGVGDNDMCKLCADDFGYAIESNDELVNLLSDPSIAIVVGGHKHEPFVRCFERGNGEAPLVFVNPGTLARDHDPCFAILDDVARRVDFVRIGDDLSICLAFSRSFQR